VRTAFVTCDKNFNGKFSIVDKSINAKKKIHVKSLTQAGKKMCVNNLLKNELFYWNNNGMSWAQIVRSVNLFFQKKKNKAPNKERKKNQFGWQ
jgi:hypothetical protein